MGARNPDSVHISQWRNKAPTLADMWRGGWKIHAYCESCGDERAVNLEAMIRINGPALSLWDHHVACPRILIAGPCRGRVFFKGRPRSGAHFDFLGALPRPRRPVAGPLSRGRGRFICEEDVEPAAVRQALGPAPPEPGDGE